MRIAIGECQLIMVTSGQWALQIKPGIHSIIHEIPVAGTCHDPNKGPKATLLVGGIAPQHLAGQGIAHQIAAMHSRHA